MAAGDLVTQQWHVEWRGMLLGYPLTAATISDLSGWLDLPAMRTGNSDRPSRHGQFAGQQRLTGRVVEASFELAAEDPALLPALRAATAPGEDPDEEPLVIWAGTDTPQLVYARVERRAIPTDRLYSMGYERATIQWSCTDPRRYSITEYSHSVGLPVTSSGGGLAFPLAFPLAWGTTITAPGGQITLTNAGDATTWPTLRITGPVTGPIVTNATTGQRLVFDPTWALGSGETVEINTDLRSVELVGFGTSYRDRLRTAEWFGVPADSTVLLQFTSTGTYSSDALLSATWRDAYF